MYKHNGNATGNAVINLFSNGQLLKWKHNVLAKGGVVPGYDPKKRKVKGYPSMLMVYQTINIEKELRYNKERQHDPSTKACLCHDCLIVKFHEHPQLVVVANEKGNLSDPISGKCFERYGIK